MDNPNTLTHDLCCAFARLVRHASSAEGVSREYLLDQARNLLGCETTALIFPGAGPIRHRMISSGDDPLSDAELVAVEALCRLTIERREPLALTARSAPAWVPHDIVASLATIRTVASAPVIVPPGDVVGVVCALSRQDITISLAHLGALEVLAHLVGETIAREQSRAEQSQREQYLASVMEFSPNAIVTIDASQRIVSLNRSAEQVFGWPAQEIVGQPLDTLIPVRFREAHRAHIARFMASGEPTRHMSKRHPVWGLRASGDEFLMDASLIQSTAGGAWRGTVILRDITEQVRAQEAQEWAERRYRELFDHAPIMYVVTRNDGGKPVIVDCNQAFLRTLGYSREEMIGRCFADFYTPASRAALLGGGYQRALEGRFTPF